MFRVGAELHHIKYSATKLPTFMELLGATTDANVWGKVVFDDCGKWSPVSTSQKACMMHPKPPVLQKQRKEINQTTTATTNHGSGNSLAGNNR